MEFCHTDLFLHSAATQRLMEFIRKRRERWATQADVSSVDHFENFEQELHTLVMALECELVREELSQYDISEKDIEVWSSVSSQCSIAGDVSHSNGGTLFVLLAEQGKGLCPLELRSGIIAGYFTPRAARQPLRWRT
jgi:hypothetical protein